MLAKGKCISLLSPISNIFFLRVYVEKDNFILDYYNRFRQLKEQEKRSKKNKAVAKDTVELLESQSESEEGSDDEVIVS